MTTGEGWLDNGLLRVEWDGDGLLTSVQDLPAGRQVLAGNERGNLFQLHDDHPAPSTPGTSTAPISTRSPTWSRWTR